MKLDDPGETAERLRDRLVRAGAVPRRPTATTTVWVTDEALDTVSDDDFSIRVSYVDLRSQQSRTWVLDQVRAFADATCSHDVDELAQMIWVELEEDVTALP